ncbi:hypothetical protein EVAR_70247_1 [Eumeta japonica]|uniref:Uncharacterized protein n=1 Tax=Eumeta variegata TaxID=151549 RepID=A0A4C2A7C4_EUMVA|nr:hypothetical protein EVAR_70247_1 [Eumeta japonica]
MQTATDPQVFFHYESSSKELDMDTKGLADTEHLSRYVDNPLIKSKDAAVLFAGNQRAPGLISARGRAAAAGARAAPANQSPLACRPRYLSSDDWCRGAGGGKNDGNEFGIHFSDGVGPVIRKLCAVAGRYKTNGNPTAGERVEKMIHVAGGRLRCGARGARAGQSRLVSGAAAPGAR